MYIPPRFEFLNMIECSLVFLLDKAYYQVNINNLQIQNFICRLQHSHCSLKTCIFVSII